MLDSGADIRDVQEFLGHSSLNTTQIYTKVRPARLQEAIGRVALGITDGTTSPIPDLAAEMLHELATMPQASST